MFAKVFVINLPFKSDRLKVFRKNYPDSLPDFEVWPAVHGDSIRHPNWWVSGAGAWGCYRSHLQILEWCYQNNIESYLVFEDDAIFIQNFDGHFAEFATELPPDWEMIYLGGQLLHEAKHPPRKISDCIYIPYNVNRTHCFAIHSRGYEKVYKHLCDQMRPREHIDHHLGRLHESGNLKIYCSGKWLVGQDGGPSNISAQHNAATFWIDPEKLAIDNRTWLERIIPAVYLEASIETAVELERRGWHRGHWQNEERLDRGVCNAIASSDIKGGLTGWYAAVSPEAVREGKNCVCLHHPSLSYNVVRDLTCAKFIHIQAETADEAEAKLRAEMSSTSDIEKENENKKKRNLVYHIWPKKGNGTWLWNVEQLLKRIDQFDGIRSIAVAIDENSDSLEDVKAAFGEVRIDNWIEVKNSVSDGEATTFNLLLDTIRADDDSITFRGHAKGVRYDNPEETRDWSSMMYEVCLDNENYVDAMLENYPCCGPFVVESDWPNHGRWHFSGAFYWFRTSELMREKSKVGNEGYWLAELWPQIMWERPQAGVLFGQTCARLYDKPELQRMKEWLAGWRQASAPKEKSETIPIYINARNLLTPLKKLVDYLLTIPKAWPIIIDNDSTWKRLIDYYDLECPVEVIRTGINGGKFGWEPHLKDHASLGIKKYVVTDSDLDLSEVPIDLLEVLSRGLDANPSVSKCGLSLDFETIPKEFQLRDEVIAHESQFWRYRRSGFCEAGIDTTFAMRRASDPIAKETHGHLRADRPYTAIHWPWNWTPKLIEESEEIRFYLDTMETTGIHWTAKMKMATEPELAIIIPTRGRPQNIVELKECFESTRANAKLIIAVDLDDPQFEEYRKIDIELFPVIRDRKGMASPLNKVAVAIRDKYRFLGFMGDDHRPRTVRWDELLLNAIRDVPNGIVYGNDLLQGRNLPTAVIMSSSIVKTLDGMVPGSMTHLYLDTFWKRLGEDLGSLKYEEDVIIEHMHPTAGKAKMDASYEETNSAHMYESDVNEFNRYISSSEYSELVNRLKNESIS